MKENIKIREDEMCPCGSEKNFSNCCYKKKRKEQNISKMIQNQGMLNYLVFDQIKSTKPKICLHPQKDECSRVIKGAHTLQNNGVLSLLAEENHVIIPEGGLDLNGIIVNIKKRGKNQATKFTCFCDIHDTKLFAPIETQQYDPKLQQQNFLYAYRAFAVEYYKKMVAFRVLQSNIKEYPDMLEEESFVVYYRAQSLSQKDMSKTLKVFNYGITERDYSVISTYVKKLDYKISFATTFCFAPCFDITGNPLCIEHLTNLSEERLPTLFVTIIPMIDESYVMISYLKKDEKIFSGFISQIDSLSIPLFKRVLNNLVPEYSEDFVLSPKLWNRFAPHMKEGLFEKMVGNLRYNNDSNADVASISRKAKLLEPTGYNLFRRF